MTNVSAPPPAHVTGFEPLLDLPLAPLELGFGTFVAWLTFVSDALMSATQTYNKWSTAFKTDFSVRPWAPRLITLVEGEPGTQAEAIKWARQLNLLRFHGKMSASMLHFTLVIDCTASEHAAEGHYSRWFNAVTKIQDPPTPAERRLRFHSMTSTRGDDHPTIQIPIWTKTTEHLRMLVWTTAQKLVSATAQRLVSTTTRRLVTGLGLQAPTPRQAARESGRVEPGRRKEGPRRRRFKAVMMPTGRRPPTTVKSAM